MPLCLSVLLEEHIVASLLLPIVSFPPRTACTSQDNKTPEIPTLQVVTERDQARRGRAGGGWNTKAKANPDERERERERAVEGGVGSWTCMVDR